jgi:hypothetical protein
MRIHDTTLEAFRAKVLETGAPVRVIAYSARTWAPIPIARGH